MTVAAMPVAGMTPTVLLGATGTVRDLVGAVLSLQGVAVHVANGDAALDAGLGAPAARSAASTQGGFR
jgi:hypothetical protein